VAKRKIFVLNMSGIKSLAGTPLPPSFLSPLRPLRIKMAWAALSNTRESVSSDIKHWEVAVLKAL